MADWTGMSRSNYFQVKDPDTFRKFMDTFPSVEIYNDLKDRPNAFCLVAEDGSWPSWRFESRGDDLGEEVEVDFIREVAPHIADGEVAVFITVGFEKARYGTGYAIAINNAGSFVEQDIDAIYDKALGAFGIKPSPAQY